MSATPSRQDGTGFKRTDFTRAVTSVLPVPLASARLFRSKRRVPTWRRSCAGENEDGVSALIVRRRP